MVGWFDLLYTNPCIRYICSHCNSLDYWFWLYSAMTEAHSSVNEVILWNCHCGNTWKKSIPLYQPWLMTCMWINFACIWLNTQEIVPNPHYHGKKELLGDSLSRNIFEQLFYLSIFYRHLIASSIFLYSLISLNNTLCFYFMRPSMELKTLFETIYVRWSVKLSSFSIYMMAICGTKIK